MTIIKTVVVIIADSSIYIYIIDEVTDQEKGRKEAILMIFKQY